MMYSIRQNSLGSLAKRTILWPLAALLAIFGTAALVALQSSRANAAVNGEPSLVAEEFVAVNGSYKGISVGFKTANFTRARSVTVVLTRADNSTVTKKASSGVIDLINNNPAGQQLTAPFVIQEGTFTEASDTLHWKPASKATWSSATRPTSVTITVVAANGKTSVTNNVFNDGAPSWPTYDSLIPLPTPTLSSPANNSHYQSAALPVAQTWSKVSGADSYLYESCSVDPGTFACPEDKLVHQQVRANNSRTVGTTAPEGAFWWHVKAMSDAGNESAWSKTRKITIDNTAPTVPVGLSTADAALSCGGFTNKLEVVPTWQASSDEGGIQGYVYSVTTPRRGENRAWSTKTRQTSYQNGEFNDGEGQYTFKVRAYDAAGNFSDWSEGCTLTYDATAPVATITSHQNGDTVSGLVELVGEVTDQNPMNTHFLVTGPNGYSRSNTYRDGRTAHQFAWDTSGLPNGEYKIQFETRDRAGNKTSVSVTRIHLNVSNN